MKGGGYKMKQNIKNRNRVFAAMLGLTFSAFLLGSFTQEIEATNMTAEWFDTPMNQRIGTPPAFSVNANTFEDGYYKNLTLDGKKFYLLRKPSHQQVFIRP